MPHALRSILVVLALMLSFAVGVFACGQDDTTTDTGWDDMPIVVRDMAQRPIDAYLYGDR